MCATLFLTCTNRKPPACLKCWDRVCETPRCQFVFSVWSIFCVWKFRVCRPDSFLYVLCSKHAKQVRRQLSIWFVFAHANSMSCLQKQLVLCLFWGESVPPTAFSSPLHLMLATTTTCSHHSQLCTFITAAGKSGLTGIVALNVFFFSFLILHSRNETEKKGGK